MLSPYPITVISGGLLATIALSDRSLIVFNDLCYVISFTCSYTNTLLFVYRYGQTVKGWMYERVLSNNKLTTFLFVSLWLILMCPLVVPVHLYAIPKTQLIEVVQKFDINLYERIKDANVVGGMREQVQVANRFTMSFAVIWGLTMFAVTLFCTYSCFRFLRQNNDRLKMIIGIFVAGLPLCFVILAYLFKMPFGSYVFSVAIRMSSIYPLSANITLIWMVRPYRNAVKDVLKKFKCVNGIEPAPQLTALQDISTIGSWQ
ncbi:hypothetical protein DdX_18158 [Ditylenchus destructor]|uniref:Uncharacterized protein n=1 Tax=Ditylenchus destructor TaxID=166010 RepID=A0AAD4ML95_9BILA|nr:hypothetical protein DdX_18158 [Ditylenchus destructor]